MSSMESPTLASTENVWTLMEATSARVTTVGLGNTVPTFTSPATQALARMGASVNLLEHTAISAIVLQGSRAETAR